MRGIVSKKRVNWNTIRAEYIAGGVSQRRLAQKYGISFSTIQKRCQREGWTSEREAAKIKIAENVIQKTASVAAENAALAQELKFKLLQRLIRTEAKFPEDATEIKIVTKDDNTESTKIYRLNDIIRGFRDLTDDEHKTKKLELEQRKFDNNNW